MLQNPIYEQQLTEGLLYQHFQPHIHCLTFTDMSIETVDAAYELTTSLDKKYAEHKWHIQYIYVFEDAPYTPYLLRKLKQSIDEVPDNLKHSAAVVSDSFLSKVLETIVVPQIAQFIVCDTCFFATDAEAFVWLAKRREV